MGKGESAALIKLPRKKVRTGCITCKIRRVKCDEQKPSCLRCTSTGRKCDGYQFLSATEFSPQAIANLAVMIPGTRQEKRAFDFFRSCTAPYLCGYYSEEFWERSVLQACYTQPALRHAAVAIGSLHETFNMLTTTPESGPINHFALAQYTKAIADLRTSLIKKQQQPAVALMACILFVCFDSLLGSVDSAILHLRSGLDILLTDPSIDTTYFGPIFTRLGLQAISFTDDRSTDDIALSFMWKLSPDPPPLSELSGFSTVAEARDSLNSLIDGMMHFFYTIPGPHNLPEDMHPSRELIRIPEPTEELKGLLGLEDPPPEIRRRRQYFSDCLQSWSKAFETLINASGQNLQGKDLRGATLLKVHHTTATIMIQATLLAPFEAMDRFTPEFAKVVSLCTSLVKADLPGQFSYFSTDLGIITPLYHTALNCHDPQIRLAALKILQVPRREGMWDSRIAAFIIERVMKLEAEGIAMHEIGSPESAEDAKEKLDTIRFDRTPREAADEIDEELRQANSAHWITYGNLIPWQRPSLFERAAMERELNALREDLAKVPAVKGLALPVGEL